ncbi:DUF2878 family protein [Thalassotalea maritima]|uniref:DUF2878 family protein n=1 Tax=Thalassotalea maritima TaxID=3242416 RepID=UPI003528D8AB
MVNWRLILNGLAFNAVWLAALAIKSIPLAVTLMMIWLIVESKQVKQHWRYLVILLSCGLLIDSGLFLLGWMEFQADILPASILLLIWLAFSFFTTYFFDATNFSWPSLALLSVVGGPSSYLAAHSLGAVHINWQQVGFTTAFIVFWFVVLPLAANMFRSLSCKKDIRY